MHHAPTMNHPLLQRFALPCLLAILSGAAVRAQPLQELAAGQEEAGPQRAPQTPKGQWILLDRVEIVANTDCLTRRALDRKITQDKRMIGTDTPAEFNALRDHIIEESLDDLLMRQAGEDLGFDEELVDARANYMWEEEVAKQGGVTQAARRLSQESKTVNEKREEIADKLYSESWARSLLGHDAGPGGRRLHDRYIRPGQVIQRYQRMKKTGLELELALGRAGATAATYDLEVLLVSPRQMKTLEAARDKLLQVRAALEADAVDWEDALLNLGEFQPSSVQASRELLVRHFDPGSGALAAFVDEAEEGSYSAVLPYAPPGPQGRRQIEGFTIYKLMGRTPAFVPDFTEPGVQKSLLYYLRTQRDNIRRQEGLAELRAKAYVWYPALEEQMAERKQALEARKAQILEAREKNAAKKATQEDAAEPKPAQE